MLLLLFLFFLSLLPDQETPSVHLSSFPSFVCVRLKAVVSFSHASFLSPNSKRIQTVTWASGVPLFTRTWSGQGRTWLT